MRERQRILHAALTALLLAALPGCTVIRGTIPSPHLLPPTGAFQAGAARVDLTPMPGFPMGGHSVAGTTARGYWTRLFARAIYLEDGSGWPLVLVSCDLWSIPAALADRVAELVAPLGIGREHIILAATHTHQSPGNFSSSELYNQFASRWQGFDSRLFEYLAQRIAGAIADAQRAKQPARVFYRGTRLPCLARNRSFEAFALNQESQEILEENSDLPVGEPSPEYPRREAYRAVDPRLSVLRIETAAAPARIVAMASFIAVHPTAMRHTTEVYSADLFGVAATLAEQKLRRDAPATPVVAIFNGAEGDVSPAWQQQDRRDALRLGRVLAEGIVALGEGGTAVDGPLGGQFAIVPLRGKCFSDAAHETRCTADAPVAGAATLGGAEDGRTVFYELGWKEGIRGPRNPGHGSKQPALDPAFLPVRLPFSISRLAMPPSSVPVDVPLGVYQLGLIAMATLPGEFTTVMGRRIAASVQQALPASPQRVLLIGLANEYVSYFTTPEEYDAQHYEGASTLYGQDAAPLVEYELTQLARHLGNSQAAPPRRFRYYPGPQHSFTLRDVGAPPHSPDEGLSELLEDLTNGRPVRDSPWFCWEDRMPELPSRHETAERVTPRVALERQDAAEKWSSVVIDGAEETDEGLDFVTIAYASGDRRSVWCSIWMPPPERDRPMTLRFHVVTLENHDLWSTPFRVAAPVPPAPAALTQAADAASAAPRCKLGADGLTSDPRMR